MYADDHPQWITFFTRQVQPFWQQQVTIHHLRRPDGVLLHWYLHQPKQPKAVVFICPGRIEAALKYQELVWQLAQENYAVVVVDHRGQGFSDRLSNNPHHGHIDQFQDFVDDLEAVVQHATRFVAGLPQYLLAHSMGGAIAALYLAQHPHTIEKAVLSSPMLGIQTGNTPLWLAKTIAVSGALLNRLLSPRKPWYFIGMEDYRYVPFDENELTHSEARYQMFRDAYESNPDIQLGGPTFNWIAQAFAAIRAAHQQAERIDVPVLILQSGDDAVVDNQGQLAFFRKLGNSHSHIQQIDGARHELFIESDRYRQPALEALLNWFQPE
ncbi:alpha/beta fold hydrolase [Pseudidiomarina donghaiensis]|uniref:alpha/beta fold hydrolase n=1 Tax=Pseudidiomarina donghaiensis TaxID=519452 RepID=UPI003A97A627